MITYPTIEQLGINERFFRQNQPMDFGADSNVWRVPFDGDVQPLDGYIVHRYHDRSAKGMMCINLYHRATREAIDFLNASPSYRVDGKAITVLPILDTAIVGGHMVSMLEFINYPRLLEFSGSWGCEVAVNRFCLDFMRNCGWTGINPGRINVRRKPSERFLGIVPKSPVRLYITDLCSIISDLKNESIDNGTY